MTISDSEALLHELVETATIGLLHRIKEGKYYCRKLFPDWLSRIIDFAPMLQKEFNMNKLMVLIVVSLAFFCVNNTMAADVVLVDMKMGFHDRVHGYSWVEDCEDCWASWLGARDSAGWLVYDTLVRVIATYELENHATSHVHEIEWFECAHQLRMQSHVSQLAEVWVSYGAKLDQSSGMIGNEEAKRWWTHDYYDDYWPFVTTHFYIQKNTPDWQSWNRSYFSSASFRGFLEEIPDSTLFIGHNPSHFQYWTVHYWATPRNQDTLWVNRDFYPECSRVHWTPADSNHVDYPTLPSDPTIYSIPQDPLRPGVYLIDPEALGLPSGQYDLLARVSATMGRPSQSFEVEADVSLDPAQRNLYELLSDEQLSPNPQILEFRSDGQSIARAPLGDLDVLWPDALNQVPPIPQE